MSIIECVFFTGAGAFLGFVFYHIRRCWSLDDQDIEFMSKQRTSYRERSLSLFLVTAWMALWVLGILLGKFLLAMVIWLALPVLFGAVIWRVQSYRSFKKHNPTKTRMHL